MNRKAKTISLGGQGEYAKVAERLKMFREDCPNGLIETEMIIDGERAIFKARVLKDKSKPDSAEATGHAVGSSKGIKAFEKQESIAVGRALAMLGYLASGEIANFEEMEEFYEMKESKKQGAIKELESAEDIEHLQQIWEALKLRGNIIAEPEVIKAKDNMKLKLEAK